MRQRKPIEVLKRIRHICAVQKQDMEMQAERSAAALRDLNSQRDAESRELEARQDGWRHAVSGRSFDLAASAFWSVEILRGEAAVEAMATQIRAAEAQRLELCRAQAGATARYDAVHDLLSEAVRGARVRQDEAALDAYVCNAPVGWRHACE